MTQYIFLYHKKYIFRINFAFFGYTKKQIRWESESYMINIRPISDLKNKYVEIENVVLNDNEIVYLTKNGYGSMVVMSIEKYYEEELQKKAKKVKKQLKADIELEEKQKRNSEIGYLNHEEVIAKARKIIDGKK